MKEKEGCDSLPGGDSGEHLVGKRNNWNQLAVINNDRRLQQPLNDGDPLKEEIKQEDAGEKRREKVDNEDEEEECWGERAPDVDIWIEKRLSSDRLANDLLWSLFVSALTHYRRDTLLRPFPARFRRPGSASSFGLTDGRAKDFELLKSVVDRVPSFLSFVGSKNQSSAQEEEGESGAKEWKAEEKETLDLVSWVLDSRNFRLRTVSDSTEKFLEIKELTGQVMETPRPTNVFEVEYSSETEAKFVEDIRSRGVIYAYHGSKVENFYSILHNGLRNHMNKNSAFGEGTYLSSELGVCMQYSPTGLGWANSLLGQNLSCVAVCQLIRHPAIQCQTRKTPSSSSCSSSASASSSSSEGGRPFVPRMNFIDQDIPEKYYIVQNDELVRVKYLLVYTEKCAGNPRSDDRLGHQRSQPRWWFRHRFVLLMIAYLLLLLAIGLGNSNYAKRMINKYLIW